METTRIAPGLAVALVLLLLVPGCGGSVPIRFTFSTGNSVQTDVPMAPPTSPVTGEPGAPVPPSAPPAAGGVR
jgi:hypothetical protein